MPRRRSKYRVRSFLASIQDALVMRRTYHKANKHHRKMERWRKKGGKLPAPK